jgi:hypothetical protein
MSSIAIDDIETLAAARNSIRMLEFSVLAWTKQIRYGPDSCSARVTTLCPASFADHGAGSGYMNVLAQVLAPDTAPLMGTFFQMRVQMVSDQGAGRPRKHS